MITAKSNPPNTYISNVSAKGPYCVYRTLRCTFDRPNQSAISLGEWFRVGLHSEILDQNQLCNPIHFKLDIFL